METITCFERFFFLVCDDYMFAFAGLNCIFQGLSHCLGPSRSLCMSSSSRLVLIVRLTMQFSANEHVAECLK